MADEDDMGGDDLGDDLGSGAPSKKRGGGGFLPGLLKWIAIGLGGVALIVTVCIVTYKLLGKNNTGAASQLISEEYKPSKELLDWYSSLGTIRTKTSDETPMSVIVEVVFGYKKDDKAVSTEISQRTVELKDFLRRYFTQKTAEELKPYNEENLKIEIRNAINDSILSSSKIKDVKFLTLDVI